jgi:hypothetical protein
LKNLVSVSRQFFAGANRCLKLHECGQFCIGLHNETFSVAAMCVSNPDRSASLAHTDRARIVFDCRMANDPANMSSTIFLVRHT